MAQPNNINDAYSRYKNGDLSVEHFHAIFLITVTNHVKSWRQEWNMDPSIDEVSFEHPIVQKVLHILKTKFDFDLETGYKENKINNLGGLLRKITHGSTSNFRRKKYTSIQKEYLDTVPEPSVENTDLYINIDKTIQRSQWYVRQHFATSNQQPIFNHKNTSAKNKRNIEVNDKYTLALLIALEEKIFSERENNFINYFLNHATEKITQEKFSDGRAIFREILTVIESQMGISKTNLSSIKNRIKTKVSQYLQKINTTYLTQEDILDKAKTYRNTEDYQQALLLYRLLVFNDINCYRAWYNIGYCLMRLKKYKLAEQLYQQFIIFLQRNLTNTKRQEATHTFLATSYQQLGNIYEQANNDWAKARMQYETALQYAPEEESYDIRANLLYALVETGFIQEAKELHLQSIPNQDYCLILQQSTQEDLQALRQFNWFNL